LLDLDPVNARINAVDREVPLRVGDGFTFRAAINISYCDARAGGRGAIGVFNVPNE
jgi:hypothetical protein